MDTTAWVGWIARRPRRVLVAVLFVSLIAALYCVQRTGGGLRFRIDPSAEALLAADDPGRALLNQVRKLFGEDDPLIVAVPFSGSVFTAERLAAIDELNKRFKALPGVTGVFSLATAPNLVVVDDALLVTSFTEQARENPEVIASFDKQLAANPLYRGALVSNDGKVTAFALTTGATQVEDYRKQDLEGQIRAAVAEVLPGTKAWITGTLPVRAATTAALERTLRFIVPGVFALVASLLMITFRSVRATFAALLSVSLALIWTLATALLLHIDFNLVTAIAPPLVITIGLSYTIHLLSAHFLSPTLVPNASPTQRREWVMRRISTGLTISAMTSVIGFLALLLNPLPAIRGFAILASFGTVYVGALTHLFLPTALGVLGVTREVSPMGQRIFAAFADRLAAFDVKYRREIIATAVALILFGAWDATRIRAGTEFVGSFSPRTVVRQDFEAISKAFGGVNLITIFVETYVNDALTDPQQIAPLAALEDWLRKQPEVGGVVGYVDHVKLLNQAFHDNDPLYYAVPETPAAVKQMLVFGGGDALQKLVDPRYRSAVISVRINVDGSIAIGDFLARLDAQLAALPPPLVAQTTGSTVLATRAVNALARGHIVSILIAIAAIGALLTVMFTSLRAGLLATVPNLVPIAIYFGTLGVLGIPLNPTTSLIACIVLGIAVNDTVHFLARFNADAREQGGEAGAIRLALRSVLRPITLATIALCLGFLVFTGSELKNQVQFGALGAWTLFVAWIADMTLTPALGAGLRIVTLWDLVRLDLGKSPQHTIPLFSGLSTRQARMFALMSNMERLPAGTRLIREGDIARDVFVMIDGQVEASIERDGERKVLSAMTRGAVMGEAGYFGQRRTASVDAVTPVRLLRFDSQDLERLRERYPSIAATIYRNLNRIQAERIARMTAMVR